MILGTLTSRLYCVAIIHKHRPLAKNMERRSFICLWGLEQLGFWIASSSTTAMAGFDYNHGNRDLFMHLRLWIHRYLYGMIV